MNFIVQLHIHTAYTPVNTITLGFAKKKAPWQGCSHLLWDIHCLFQYCMTNMKRCRRLN